MKSVQRFEDKLSLKRTGITELKTKVKTLEGRIIETWRKKTTLHYEIVSVKLYEKQDTIALSGEAVPAVSPNRNWRIIALGLIGDYFSLIIPCKIAA